MQVALRDGKPVWLMARLPEPSQPLGSRWTAMVAVVRSAARLVAQLVVQGQVATRAGWWQLAVQLAVQVAQPVEWALRATSKKLHVMR